MDEKKDLLSIEKSLIKTYRKDIWAKFVKASLDYKLIEENDRIAVAISGGKDSILLAKLFQELKKIKIINFDVHYISMNPGFSNDNLELLIKNCNYLNIPVEIKESDVFMVAKKLSPDKPCYMCARMRRGFLYRFAQELGCNKLALGHHFDDVIETILLNILYAGNYKTMLPKLKSENFDNMELIRPLYLIKEEAIKKWIKYANIKTMNCGCEVAKGEINSKRREIKELIKKMKETNPFVDINIFRSSENINLEQIIGYTSNDKKTTFLDMYEKEE